MRRRRRSRGTWFPVIGTTPADPDRQPRSAFELLLEIGTADAAIPVWGIIPLTLDTPKEGSDLQDGVDSLADIMGSEYFLQRIVGKCHLNYRYPVAAQSLDTSADSSVYVVAGFFVARAGFGAGFGANAPIGLEAGPTEQNYNDYAPDALATIREPWIWRRSWVLGTGVRDQANANTTGFAAVATNVQSCGPGNNWEGRALGDGPHIDAKTRRRVHNDERLFFALSARNREASTLNTADAAYIKCTLDVRLFGSLRKSKNSGNF